MTDVSKPGKTAPSASSRPIIIGHGPMVKDSMMTEPADTAETEEKVEVTRTAPKVVVPISDAADVQKTEPETEAKPQPEAEETPADTETAEDQKAEEGSPAPADTTTEQESAVVDAVVEKADAKKSEAKLSEEEKKHQAEIEKLIASKKYNLPIGARTRKKRRNKGLIAFVIVLLLIAGGYAAADKFTDLPLPYEFFKTKQAESSPKDTIRSENTVAQSKASTKVFTSKESGVSFTHPAGWVVKQQANNSPCPLHASEAEKPLANGDTPGDIKCPYSGSILLDDTAEAQEIASYWIFTSSTKELSTIYLDKVDSLSSVKHEQFVTKSGLKAIMVNQPLESNNGVASDNLYVVELAAGTYLWLNNREYISLNPNDATESTPGTKITDLRKYSQQVSALVKSVNYTKP